MSSTSRLRRLIAASAGLAVVATTMVGPVSGASGKGAIGIVNGRPGVRVDICINGREIRSNVRYGGRASKLLSAGVKRLKVFRADERRCRGTLLGRKTVELSAADDHTVVFTRKHPKFLVFDNITGIVAAGPGDPFPDALVHWRHAADLGDMWFRYQMADPPTPYTSSLERIWQKGTHIYLGGKPAGTSIRLQATRPDRTRVIAKSPWIDTDAGKRYEWMLLGTKPRNAKFIVWARDVVQPPP